MNLVLCILCAYPLSKSDARFRARKVYVWIFLFATLFNGGLIDRVANADRGAFVAAEHANTAVSDESGGRVLRTGRVAVAVLGLLKLKLGTLESGAEAVVTGHGGSRRSIDADNADLAFRDALRSQLVDHGLAGSLTGCGVIGAERRNRRRKVCRGIDVDDLHASRRGLLQRIVDRLGAVGRQKDRSEGL